MNNLNSEIKSKIAVIGSINMDLKIKVPHLSSPGETVLPCEFNSSCGGKGANQAVGAAKLGAEVYFLGRVGKDAYGKSLLANLNEHEVNTDHIIVDSRNTTGIATILLDEAAENYIYVAPGANYSWESSDLEKLPEFTANSDYFLLQNEIPIDVTEFVISRAKFEDKFIIWDPAPVLKYSQDICKNIDIITPNQQETELLTGVKAETVEEAKIAGQQLISMGFLNVIITLGELGCLLTTPTDHVYYPSFNVQVVDTVSAGDAFNATLAVYLSQGSELKDAIYYANVAGALAVSKLGSQESMPTKTDIEEFLTEVKLK